MHWLANEQLDTILENSPNFDLIEGGLSPEMREQLLRLQQAAADDRMSDQRNQLTVEAVRETLNRAYLELDGGEDRARLRLIMKELDMTPPARGSDSPGQTR